MSSKPKRKRTIKTTKKYEIATYSSDDNSDYDFDDSHDEAFDEDEAAQVGGTFQDESNIESSKKRKMTEKAIGDVIERPNKIRHRFGGAVGEAGVEDVIEATAGLEVNNEDVEDNNRLQVEEKNIEYRLTLNKILDIPRWYIGPLKPIETKMWIYDKESNTMKYKKLNISSGLLTIFDSILINAANHKIEDPGMNILKVKIDQKENKIIIFDNASVVPIYVGDEKKVRTPDIITNNISRKINSYRNYLEEQKLGNPIKVANILSKTFQVEIGDSNGTIYLQKWINNGTVVEPKITDLTRNINYTSITFTPDLKVFGMNHLDEDMVNIMKTRVHQLCATLDGVEITMNDIKLKPRTFKSYVDKIITNLKVQEMIRFNNGDISVIIDKPIIHANLNDGWEIAVVINGGPINQVSFVNHFATINGGTHVNSIFDQIINYFTDELTGKMGARRTRIRASWIESNFCLFINCKIKDPVFYSRANDALKTKANMHEPRGLLTFDFLSTVFNQFLTVKSLEEITYRKVETKWSKEDGGKVEVNYVDGLYDANKAGTPEGFKCTLMLVDGNSALSFALSGLEVIGRDYNGVLPLHGKLPNVRDTSLVEEITDKNDIEAIRFSMGLEYNKVYTNTDKLRYGHVMIVTNNDYEGSYTKGLIINLFEKLFPGLLSTPGFLVEFVTPLVEVSIARNMKDPKILPFYTEYEFNQWKQTQGKKVVWQEKYCGVLHKSNAPLQFSKLEKYLRTFDELKQKDSQMLDIIFCKGKEEEKKKWLESFQPTLHIEPSLVLLTIEDFINKELIWYLMGENFCSIPSLMDGLKPNQRKILHGCFKAKLVNDYVCVSELGEYVLEKIGYKDGQSINQTIIELAQDFVGSNNINFLIPNGNFGSVVYGGKDALEPYDLFTTLNQLTRKLFLPSDNSLLNYIQDEGRNCEPEWFAPIIPTLLINGAEGIGNGWSTNIPCYNPLDIVENIKRLLNKEEIKEMIPWYKGWNGSLQPNSDGFKISGIINQIDETTLEITELPVKMWTSTMREFLHNSTKRGGTSSELDQEFIESVVEDHESSKFIITLDKTQMAKAKLQGLKETFKLETTLTIGNMVAIDSQGKLKQYLSAEHILVEYFHIRLELYQKRKTYKCEKLNNQLEKIYILTRFIKMILDGELTIVGVPNEELCNQLESLGFPKFTERGVPVYRKEPEIVEEIEEDGGEVYGGEVFDEVDNDVETNERPYNYELYENYEDNEDGLDGEGVFYGGEFSDDDEDYYDEVEEEEDDDEVEEEDDDDLLLINQPIPNYDLLFEFKNLSLSELTEIYEDLLIKLKSKEQTLKVLLNLTAEDLWNKDLDEFLTLWRSIEYS